MKQELKIKNSTKIFIQKYFDELNRCLNKLDKDKIEQVIEVLMTAYRNGKKVFIMGNGGSASAASHIACDLGKGTLQRIYDIHERRFKVYSLTDNVALMTAFANDVSFKDIFLQQLRNLVEPGDVVIALSGSGNSMNVVKAVKYAKRCKAYTIGFLGFKKGGKLGKSVDLALVVDSNVYGICEDIQLVLDHIITMWIAKIKRRHDGIHSRKALKVTDVKYRIRPVVPEIPYHPNIRKPTIHA